MEQGKLQCVVEALLFASEGPISLREIREVLHAKGDAVTQVELEKVLESLKASYAEARRSFQVFEVASGFQIKTLSEFAPYVLEMYQEQLREKLTVPTLETLSIIAYKQPVTRAEVESVRGVNIDGIMKTLLDKDLVRIVGKKDVPGKPFLFGTTRGFLMHFGLKDLNELPNVEEFRQALLHVPGQDAKGAEEQGNKEEPATADEKT